ncbi:MAG: NTP transferase domain-containing protein [Candidatus Omnitrophica bacterium]|nr:NTP transferase domain-containing protein [Candidatus Omnitrophota bacterium]MBU4473150.1 NTP transferase domain-containing protein [Candidatus Omnitrophota bacterium]MCG2706437.1 NTP transferase domain-containing protein [Candidatus Omnitrophota bacterium]
MKSAIPKVLYPICGRPMLSYVLDLVKDLKINRVIVVLGHKHKEVKKLLEPGVRVVIQKRLRGTADALKETLPLLRNFRGTVLVLYADNPLLKKDTIKKLLGYHIENNLDATLLTAQVDKASGYGRILRDKYAGICGIIEEKDANDFQKEIKEINTGIICFHKDRLFDALRYVKADNRKKEYYLTDAIGIIYKNGGLIDGIKVSDTREVLGINSRVDLASASRIMQQRINEGLMERGITIIDPQTTFIGYGVRIGRDTTIYPFTVIERDVKIGRHCVLGPFVHLRAGTRLKDNVTAGNFLEIVRSRVSAKTMIKHFGYLGDSRIGRQVNIGAGTVTANFDGKKKNVTVIGDKAFIGSDTILVAPVKIGKAAQTGAGSVVVRHKNVPARSVVVGVPAKPISERKR